VRLGFRHESTSSHCAADNHARLTPGSHTALLAITIALNACHGSTQPPAKPSQQSTKSSSAISAEQTLDLSISYNPGLTAHVGWTQLNKPLPLQYLGSRGANIESFENWKQLQNNAVFQKVFEMKLAHLKWSATSIQLNDDDLCSAQFREAVRKAAPPRLLLRLESGISATTVACLKQLQTPRLYLAGCLYRKHRSGDRCNGDAELSVLAADTILSSRVLGLAVSLSNREAVQQLSAFANLEYLAIASGAPASTSSFDSLPLSALKNVRYLDIGTWGDQEQRPTGGHEEQKFLGQLHTLRWSGRITYPLAACEIRRISSDRLTDDDINGLANCSKLLEISTDQADIESPSKLISFTRLERLHLRHLHAVDASPIAQLTALRELSLPAAKMTSFDFISSLNELRVLDLSQTMLASIEPLAKLTRLETLNVFEDKITYLSPLRNLTMLTELDLAIPKS
jgi:hypothetical protein